MSTQATPASSEATPRRYQFTLVLTPDKHVELVPPWPESGINPGDEVQFTSKDGEIKIEFKPKHAGGKVPFRENTIDTSDYHVVENASEFVAECYIKPAGEKEYRRYQGEGTHGCTSC